jgi:hypothetical protein
MAEYTTFIFPTETKFRPTDESIERASAYLDEIYLGHYSSAAVHHEKPAFLDSGADFDRFKCPECGTTVKMHDPSGWWYGQDWSSMSDEDHLVTVPCCGASIPFKALCVSEITGFAVFHFEIEGAGEDYLPNQQQLSHIGELLGCPMRHIISVSD